MNGTKPTTWYFAGDCAVSRTTLNTISNKFSSCEKASFQKHAYVDERRRADRQNGCRQIL